MIRFLVDSYNKPVPAILEIRSKDHPYDPSHDSVLSRVKYLFSAESVASALNMSKFCTVQVADTIILLVEDYICAHHCMSCFSFHLHWLIYVVALYYFFVPNYELLNATCVLVMVIIGTSCHVECQEDRSSSFSNYSCFWSFVSNLGKTLQFLAT